MGLPIGDSLNTLTVARQAQGLVNRVNEANQADRVSVGFGSQTISVPAAAALTVRRGVDEARQLVPTLEESQATLRERLIEQREAFGEELEEFEPQQLTLDLRDGQVNAASQARQLVNGINAAATQAASRLSGAEETPPPDNGGPSINIGGRTFEFGAPETGNLLNILA